MTISVTQLNNYIKGILDLDGVLNDLSVCGEITNVKQAREGWYFSLKDENSAIDCFSYGQQPQTGMTAVAEGRISFWQRSGRLSFYVRRLTVGNQSGAAYLQFLQIKEKLQKEGLFDEQRKKPVPVMCMKVGVVTSATGAVITDICNVIHRRQPFTDIFLYPVKVQGEGASAEIAQGVTYFSQSGVDAVIVGRGGGSNEDLSAFNAEEVVRAVASCAKPVVSAVGHGVDFTLCDFAADRRAVTPSEAAELVTSDSAAVKSAVVSRLLKCAAQLQRRTAAAKASATYCTHAVLSHVRLSLQRGSSRIYAALKGQAAAVENKRVVRQMRLQNATARLSAANPANVLRRGYAYVSKQGDKINSVLSLKKGDCVDVTFCDGSVQAVIGDKL